ncbi:MAG: hypothetical protein JWO60_2928 [Frankiales bacterium]|jgi:threonine/homoserine/homoserine lactone efflux protein|nr:hypothetical protein [Frankiales bacterium]
MNAALALFLLAFLAPAVTRLDDISTWVAVVVVVFALPVLLVVLLCLASAIRPGSLGRAARRGRERHRARAEQVPEA